MARNLFTTQVIKMGGGGGPPGPQPDPLLLPYLPEAWLWAAQPGARDNLDPLDFVEFTGPNAVGASASLGPSGEIVVQLAGATMGVGPPLYINSLVAGLSWTFPGGPIAEGDKLSIVLQVDGGDPQNPGPSLYICAGLADYTVFPAQIGAQMDIPSFGVVTQLRGFVGYAGGFTQDWNLPHISEINNRTNSLPLLITLEALPGRETAIGLAPAYGQPFTGVHDGTYGAFEGAEKFRFYSFEESSSGEITLKPATFRILGIKLDRA